MSNLFLHLLNISITAGWIVLVVVLLRFVLKKAPKWIRVVLWGLVALRLMLPVSIESALSLVPSAETVRIEPVTAPVFASVRDSNGSSYFFEDVQGERIMLQSGFSALNSAVNPTPEKAAEHFDTIAVLKSVAGWVWLAGVCGMLLYALISFLRLRHRVRASVLLEKGVYVCDEISDPFILGLIVPKIYLPSGMDEQTRAYVLSHERAHLRRFDYIWKPLGFLLLSVYWFNPLLWLAYILLCRDIELACDEKVVKELDDAGKAAYSEALVHASVSRRMVSACPLAFGETGVKGRVKSILNYKKPAFWIILVAILSGIAVAVCFLTMPKKDKIKDLTSDGNVTVWYEDWDLESNAPDGPQSVSVDAFPGVTFRWKDDNWGDSILAEENGKTRKLFSGMPVWNVFFADVTGDGKPELCASVYFGSGIVDEHIVVYDYVNKQSYVLWDRGTFDYHLSLDDGALQVIKRIFNTSILPTDNGAFGELVMEDGLLCCHWRNDGSSAPLIRELHESELTGEWLVEEETDNDGNVLYTRSADLWKEYSFREDGTVVYNETVPISSDSEKAFGHPVEYAYEVYDDHVFIENGRSASAYLDPQTGKLKLNYQPSTGQYVYATLKRMGEDLPETDAQATPQPELTYVGTWEFYKSISETCEEDAAVHVMCGYSEDNMILREDGTGSFITLYNDRVTELTFTYTVSGDHLVILITDATHPLDAYYDQTANTLTIPDSAVGEGNRWTDVFIREGSITYPEVHLTVEQLVGEWITDGIAVMKGRPLTLSGTLSLDTNGIASMHLNGDADTKMQIDSTFVPDGSIIRFTPDGKDSSLSYYPWLSEDLLYTLDTSNFLADSAGSVLASYDPQSDTIRFMVYDFGVLTFRRKITAVALSSDGNVTVWYEDWDFENSAPDGPQSVTVPAFPGVTFRWTAGSVEAVESGKTHTLFTGMPIRNVFFADVTGDGKPELCATVYFGSGIVDSHIVVYDYTNKQSYVLWERGTFDYHLYTVDGKLLVGKTPNMGDKQVDSGTIMQQGSALFCRFQSDGSMNPLIRELHESELTGEWLVEEETDNDGNVLYTRSADLWKEYNFREDGTVTYNETVPVSSNYELAFGHPVTYPYQLHDNYVYIAGDDTSGAFRWGSYDRDTRALTLMYNTPDGTVYAKLRRMGEGASEDSALASLRQNVPEYFDLPADKGLEIYVWQMAPDDYSFGVMAGTNLRKENELLWNLRGVSAEQMRLILSTYDIAPENIEVIPIIKPFSDYAYEIDDAYTARVRNMLFGK